MMPSWVDEKYTKRELGWIRIAGEWRPTVVLDGIPVQVSVDPRIGVGPLAEAWGPRVAEPSEKPVELDDRAEGIASCLGHVVFQHGGSAELAGAIQKWIRDHLDAPAGVTAPTSRQRVAQRFIAEQMPIIRAAARAIGYAIAIHGTLDRDVDLVAIPWTAEAADADALAAAVRDAMHGAFATTTDGRVQTEDCNRPHGRRTWAIGSVRLWGSYIDLSVMPRAKDGCTKCGKVLVVPEENKPYTCGACFSAEAALRDALVAAIEELSEWSKDCEDPESNERAGAVFRQAERALAGIAPDRPHKLTWNGTDWVAPCGCRYHPDDDNGSHGGAPHVHRCEKHGKAPEWRAGEREAVARCVGHALAELMHGGPRARWQASLEEAAVMLGELEREPDGTAPERAPKGNDDEGMDDLDAALRPTVSPALDVGPSSEVATRPPDGMPGAPACEGSFRMVDGAIADVCSDCGRSGDDHPEAPPTRDSEPCEHGWSHRICCDICTPTESSAPPTVPGEPTATASMRAGLNLAMALRLQRLVLNAASAAGVDPARDEWTAFDWQRICDVLAKQIDAQPPIPMLLTCPQPNCGARHIDRGDFATKPHHTHTCQACGHTWRPAKVHTVGVDFLPGFHDHDQRENDLRAELGKFCAVLENPDWKRMDVDDASPESHIARNLRAILAGEREGAPSSDDPCH